MNKDYFSVIIPTYNRANFLKKAIDSVLSQSYEHYEIIVIDDGSVDNTKELIKSYCSQKIIYVRQDNKGVSEARNLGIKISTGTFIAFLDDDDLYHENKLEVCFGYLKKRIDTNFFCSNFMFIDEKGDKTMRGDVINNYSEVNLHNIAMFDLIHTSSVVIRKVAIGENTLFPREQKVSEDYYMWSEILKNGNGYNIPETLTYFRQHGKNTKISSLQLYKENRKIIDKIFSAPQNYLFCKSHYIKNLKKIIEDNLIYRKKYFEIIFFKLLCIIMKR